jgi:hypothetical protein
MATNEDGKTNMMTRVGLTRSETVIIQIQEWMFFSLEEVMYDNKRLFLVFEYLELDLKKFMDTTPNLSQNRQLIKVIPLSNSDSRLISKLNATAPPRTDPPDPAAAATVYPATVKVALKGRASCNQVLFCLHCTKTLPSPSS